MKRQVLRVEWVGCFLFLVVILWEIGSVQAQTIGKTVDKSNVQEYKDLLIPPLLEAVKRGDWTLHTGNLGFPYKHWDRFLAASEKNAGKFDVNEMGDLIDKSTGKIPKYNIYGFPFPKIDHTDPMVAVKIMWNFNFQIYRFMGIAQRTPTRWIGKGEEERYISGQPFLLYYQGRPPGQELKNPQNFLTNEFQNVTEPMSVRGMSSLAWDYFDERDISNFAYIPAIRRIRQTSGASRSDPYMGSDGWLDLQNLWAGKNRSMKWKLVGERTVLVPFTKITKDIVDEAPDGTITRKIPVTKWGFRTPGWKGPAWAPLDMNYVPRSVWVVEQFPKDPYYNWGLHINYVDKETYVIHLKEVYDKAGQFRTWVQMPLHYSEAPSGNNTVGDYDDILIIDERIRHSLLSERQEHPEYSKVFMPAKRLGPDFFTLSNFLQLSK